MPARAAHRSGLVLATWTIALAALAALAVAVAHYLGGSGSSSTGMAGMHGTAHALARAGGDPAGPLLGSALVTKWQLNALALAVLVLAAAWYLTAAALVPVREPGARWPLRHTLTFLAGLVVCGYATNGAIAVYDQVLFTAHMAGHLALVMLAPALLVAGHPFDLALAASTPRRRERMARILRGRVVSVLLTPPIALATYTVVIVGSHLTGLMDTIMRNSWVGEIEHLVYVIAGIQFFVLVVGDHPIRWRLSSPVRWLLLAVGMAVDTFTGIVLMQGSGAVAMVHSAQVHVDPLSDTHTGGAIMWFGGDALMAIVMVALVIGWLRRVETDQADEKGWLEQARRATFSAHTGNDSTAADTFDDDDAARASYNAWLANLERRG
ncbi:MAG TPA: cytochrome c oxidase assembly protein [Jatrophihabitantaceae bacterium]|jgi:putative copper resistance protein D|nr:cytochrome c oxidase assembly protein [Jatrophihabitantaceae bacterium]